MSLAHHIIMKWPALPQKRFMHSFEKWFSFNFIIKFPISDPLIYYSVSYIGIYYYFLQYIYSWMTLYYILRFCGMSYCLIKSIKISTICNRFITFRENLLVYILAKLSAWKIWGMIKILWDHPFKMSTFFRGEGSKICQICQRIVVKNCQR